MHSEHSSSAQRGQLEPANMGLVDYWHALWSQRLLIIVITVATTVLVLGLTLLMTPKYRASSTLQIERDSLNVVNVDSLMPVESPQDRDFYETQYELLRSRSLARAVIREAKLDQDPAFKPIVEEALAKAQASEGEGGGTALSRRQDIVERALTGAVLEGLEIEPIRNSRLVRVNYDSPDPALAARIANAYSRVFIVNSQERKMNASSFATKYLSERLEQLRARLEDSEKELVAYSSQEQIVAVDGQPSLPAQNLTELNAMLAAAQDARIKAEAAWRQASTGDSMALPQVVSNPLVQSLRSEQVRLNAEYQQKLSTFKPQYPEMQRLQSQVAEVQKQIRSEVANIRQSLKAQYDAAAQQETLLTDNIAALKGDELDLQTRSIRYNMLKRDADTNRQLYDALLQRYKEIGVAGNVGSNNVSVIDIADVPRNPSSPKTLLNVAVGLIFGFFIAIAIALVRFFLRTPKPA